MIKATITISDKTKKIIGIEVKGHADSDEEGKDLVCAGVSAVVFGGINNLQKPKNFDIFIAKGEFKIKSLENIDEHDSIVLETILSGLKTIEEDNKKYIQIKEEII